MRAQMEYAKKGKCATGSHVLSLPFSDKSEFSGSCACGPNGHQWHLPLQFMRKFKFQCFIPVSESLCKTVQLHIVILRTRKPAIAKVTGSSSSTAIEYGLAGWL